MIVPSKGAETKPRVSTGIAGLDTLLGGGFMLGGIYIVQGSPGAGKTILTNQICFNHVAHGGRAVFVTLLAENHARLLDNLRGLAFFDQSIIPDRLIYLSAFSSMRDDGLEGLANLLRRDIQRRRTTLLVIDGLVSVQASSSDDKEFREFVRALQEIALATDCTMLLTTNDNRTTSPEQTMVDGLIVLSDRNYGWQAASDVQVTKFRGSGYLRGRHSYRISNDGISVYPRIEALYAYPSLQDQVRDERVTTGVQQLDTILGGGLPAESTTLLIGPSGIGKTTLGLQFLCRSTADEPGLMFGFYETSARLRVKGRRFEPRFGDLMDQGAIELLWQPPTSNLLDAYGEQLIDAVRRRQVKRLFIDGLTAFQNSANDPSRAGNFFSALSNELRVLGVTTIYTLEIPDVLGRAIRVPLNDASTLAENMILVRFVEKRSRLYRLLSVLKVRDSDFDASAHEFSIADEGVNISATAASAEWILGHEPADDRSADAPSAEPTRRGA